MAQISELAGRQHGFVTRGQLLALGVSARTIGRWLQEGWLIGVHQGVYAVGHREYTPLHIAHAAVLACGDDAALSFDSAAALWTIRRWPRIPEVSAPTERRRPGIRTHHSQTLGRRDITVHFGISITTPVRTIIDGAPRLDDRRLIRAIDDLRLAHHLGRERLTELLDRCARAKQLIDPAQNPTRSPLEIDFLAFVRRFGLPMPLINAPLGSRIVDALYEEHKLIVEVDSYDHHQDRNAFEDDRERDAAHRALGYETHRITSRRLDRREADRLRAILAHRWRLLH